VSRHSELQGKADRGEPLQESAPIMFSSWADDWYARAKTRTKSPDTLLTHITKHLKPAFASKALNTISIHDVNTWISEQLSTAKPGTVKRQFNTLRAILNDAVQAGHMSANPCRFAQKIRGVTGRQRYLDGDEIKHLLEVAQRKREWFHDYILWAIHSGMRKSETARLRWVNIQQLDATGTFVLIPQTKADQPRVIVCTETMREVLTRQKARVQNADNRVFPIAPITLRRMWQAVRNEANLNDVVLHDLRRTHATHAVSSGTDLVTLSTHLGHRDLSMLQKHYAVYIGTNAANAAHSFQITYDKLMSSGTTSSAAT
jgi:integrase